MFVYEIFRVIYAPRRAFKEIAQNPKYIGPLLIMILFVAVNTGSIYIVASKAYVEQTLPTAEQLDEWTENAALWTANPEITPIDNQNDYINGTYYGNESIEFQFIDSKLVSMQLNNIGQIDCSDPDGYKNLSLRTKWTIPTVKPENVTIYLFSSTLSDYFYYNLTENFSNSSSNIWNNLTIPLGSQKWLNSSATADWGNITGLKLELAWHEYSNITVLVDGLFFRGVFKSQAENISGYLLNFSLIAFMQFTIKWVFLGGIIYIMAKAFGGAKAVWKTLLIVIGCALITMLIQVAINAATFSTSLPPLYYNLEFIGGVRGESETAYLKILEDTFLVSQITTYVQLAVYVWTIALCAIATRLLAELSWNKSFLIAVAAYLATLVAERFLLGF